MFRFVQKRIYGQTTSRNSRVSGPIRADPEPNPLHRLEREVEPDRIVQTHCCFCGQQCGIQLKVKDNRVVGFEPWEEFPFNQGKLAPRA